MAQQRQKLLEIRSQGLHLCFVRNNTVSSQDIVGIIRALRRDHATEHDIFRFLDRELRAFDKIGEIGFKESKVCIRLTLSFWDRALSGHCLS